MIRILVPDDPGARALEHHVDAVHRGLADVEVAAWDGYRGRLERTLAERAPSFDAVAVPGHVWLPELAEAGLVAELAEDLAAARRGVVPSLDIDCSYHGRTHLLPLFSDGHLVVMRADLLPAPGAAPGPGELLELARAAHHPPAIYGTALKASPAEIFLDWLPHYWMAGGRLEVDDGVPRLDADAATTALESYLALAQLAPPDIADYGNEGVAAALREGRVAMAMTWGGQAAPIFAHPPAGGRFVAVAPRIPWNGTWGLAIPARHDPARRRAVEATLLEIMTPALDERVLTEAGSPVLSATYEAAAASPGGLAGGRHAWLEAQRSMLARARPLPATPALGPLLTAVTDALVSALHHEASPDEAIAAACRRMLG